MAKKPISDKCQFKVIEGIDSGGEDGIHVFTKSDAMKEVMANTKLAKVSQIIDEIVILNTAPDNENKEYRTGTVSEKRYLTIGDVIGNYDFINHKNEKVSLSHFNDKVLVITFIYTRCPVPDFCPQLSLKFKSALESLSTELPNQNAYQFLSITFDPEHDTPNVLNNYAKLYEGDNHNNWSFLTSSTEEIQKFTDEIGLVISREKESILDWDHNLRTLVTNQSGMIKTILIGNLWSADELVNEIKELLAGHR